MKIKKDIEKVLELTPIEGEIVTSTKEEPLIVDDSKEKDETTLGVDFDNARNKIYDLIEVGDTLLENCTELAKAGDSARVYEVAGDLLSKMVQAQKDLIELHQRRKAIEKENVKQDVDNTINIEGNAIFTGSTTDLLKLIKENGKSK